MSLILDLLREEGMVEIDKLADMFGVSAMTVRRDIADAHRAGAAVRVRGGALASLTGEYGYSLRNREQLAEKAMIGAAAARLVLPGDVIYLDTGSTSERVAWTLSRSRVPDVVILTPAVNVSARLCNVKEYRVIQLAGQVQSHTMGTAGPLAAKTLEGLQINRAFLGANGIDLDVGITNISIDEVELKKRVLEISSEKLVLADSSKLNRVSFAKICDIEDIDVLITDNTWGSRGMQVNFFDALKARGVETLFAEVMEGVER